MVFLFTCICHRCSAAEFSRRLCKENMPNVCTFRIESTLHMKIRMTHRTPNTSCRLFELSKLLCSLSLGWLSFFLCVPFAVIFFFFAALSSSMFFIHVPYFSWTEAVFFCHRLLEHREELLNSLTIEGHRTTHARSLWLTKRDIWVSFHESSEPVSTRERMFDSCLFRNTEGKFANIHLC